MARPILMGALAAAAPALAATSAAAATTLPTGSLVVEGPFDDTADSSPAIIGGTGRWAGARGQITLHARDAAGSSYDFRFSVIN